MNVPAPCVLLLNAGSSSLKGSLLAVGDERVVAECHAEWAGSLPTYEFVTATGERTECPLPHGAHADAVRQFILDLQSLTNGLPSLDGLLAVGHRVVHGGHFRNAVAITADVRAEIERLSVLAPLHNPASLKALDVARELLPDHPHVAVFDTAFHATLPPEAATYAIPWEWTTDWGIRRYGFHGLSYDYCSQRAAEMLGRPLSELRLIVCHLGHGCSMSAIAGGRSIDTTMGFTPLDGLMMATRSGVLDPSVPPFLERAHGLTSREIETTLNSRSGLLGVSGISADLRLVLQAAAQGHERARLAIDIYVRRIQQTIGAYFVTLDGVDAIIFTAGVGEHSSEIRSRVGAGLAPLGLAIEQSANEHCQPDANIAASGSPPVLVIETREDLSMLRQVLQTPASS